MTNNRRPRFPSGPGCLLAGAIFFLLLGVFGSGLGQRYTYWLQIDQVQAFEGEDGLVLFVEVRRASRYPGFLQSGQIRKTMQLIRVDVSRDGEISQTPLIFDEGTTFHTNIAPIIRLPDHFYLVQQPSMRRPACQLHRVLADRIEPRSFEESGEILRRLGLRCGGAQGLKEFDLISKRSGWERLNGNSYMFGSDFPIVSRRHGMRLLVVEDGRSQSIVAESIRGPNPWSRPLVRVSSRRWRSYKGPMH